MGEDGARGRDWSRVWGHHVPESYRYNFLVSTEMKKINIRSILIPITYRFNCTSDIFID